VDEHPISASLSRPLLAKIAYEQAQSYGIDLIIHTANPTQNSLRRFDGPSKLPMADGMENSKLPLMKLWS